MKSLVLLTLVGTCFVLATTSVASNRSRLEISLVPTWIYTTDNDGELHRANPEELGKALVNMHRALAIVGVQGDEYNLKVVAPAQHQTLLCTQTLAGGGNPPECKHPHDGPYGVLREDQILNLAYTMTGVYRHHPLDRGRIEYFVLLTTKHFVWGSTYYGGNSGGVGMASNQKTCIGRRHPVRSGRTRGYTTWRMN